MKKMSLSKIKIFFFVPVYYWLFFLHKLDTFSVDRKLIFPSKQMNSRRLKTYYIYFQLSCLLQIWMNIECVNWIIKIYMHVLNKFWFRIDICSCCFACSECNMCLKKPNVVLVSRVRLIDLYMYSGSLLCNPDSNKIYHEQRRRLNLITHAINS